MKIRALQEARDILHSAVYKEIALLGVDPDSLDFENDLLQQINPAFRMQTTSNRFNRAYQLWASTPKIENHFMFDTCTTRDTHMNTPISEQYNTDAFLQTLSEGGMFDTLTKHDNIIIVDGLFAITYTETSDKDLFRNLRDLHPYCVAHTIHELFKLMLEWQWAYLELNSTEPMAKLCNDSLEYLGVNYFANTDTTNALKELPDSFLAQYIKGQELSVPLTDPVQPIAFSLWLVDKGIMNFQRVDWANLFSNYLNLNKINQKLRLLGEQ
jgi:hypothetical protein